LIKKPCLIQLFKRMTDMNIKKEMKDYITREEIQNFTKKNDLQAYRVIIFNWLAIFGSFAFIYYWTNTLSILIALPLLAARQLDLSIIMHDCGHNILFSPKKKNAFYGQWFDEISVLQD